MRNQIAMKSFEKGMQFFRQKYYHHAVQCWGTALEYSSRI